MYVIVVDFEMLVSMRKYVCDDVSGHRIDYIMCIDCLSLQNSHKIMQPYDANGLPTFMPYYTPTLLAMI